MRPLLTVAEMRRVEERFVERGGNLDQLMAQAGMQVAARVPVGMRVLILVGPGNNGGDALFAAETIRERGDDARVYVYKRREIQPEWLSDEEGTTSVLASELEDVDVVIDGLLGIGRKRPVDGQLASIIDLVNRTQVHRIAIDLPTGIDPDTGAVDTVAFKADTTITLGFGKRGLWGVPGADFAGDIEVADIGFIPGSASEARCFLLDEDDIRPLLPRRDRDWNKGKSGRLLVVSGSVNYSGAPTLVSTAAYRAGAGLVQLAVPDAVRPICAGREVEAVFAPIAATDFLTTESMQVVVDAAKQSNAVAIGPGLGNHAETVDFVRQLLPQLREVDVPIVLDADGLNAVAEEPNWWSKVPSRTVVTPHPGEMSRLLGRSVEEVQRGRFDCAREAADRWGVIVILKGSDSVVATPGKPLFVCPLGGPNLGTGGTGDVLTGIIGGYLAQGLAPHDAAVAAVWVHAAAGDLLRNELGQTGTVASDLWARIPRVRKDLLEPIGFD